MKKLSIALLALALPCLSQGQLILFNAQMTGGQEAPTPRETPAFGNATATLNTATNFFVLDYWFAGLLGPQTAAHIHRAPIGVSGPILIGAPSFPLGSPIHLEIFVTEAEEADLVAGLTYLNVHSTVFPAGEIRGQLLPVPEPSTYGLIAACVLVGGVLFRRARARRALQI